MILVYCDVPEFLCNGLDKLIRRLEVVKAAERDGVVNPRVMCIEGDDVAHTHSCQLLQCKCCVEGFELGTLVLPALI